jgi:hypothetical protein
MTMMTTRSERMEMIEDDLIEAEGDAEISLEDYCNKLKQAGLLVSDEQIKIIQNRLGATCRSIAHSAYWRGRESAQSEREEEVKNKAI